MSAAVIVLSQRRLRRPVFPRGGLPSLREDGYYWVTVRGKEFLGTVPAFFSGGRWKVFGYLLRKSDDRVQVVKKMDQPLP